MPNILDEIVAHKRQEVADCLAARPLEQVIAAAGEADPPRNFFCALTQPPAGKLHVIAEVKKASPSAGVIRSDFDPVAIARQYEAAGADAISVLTDEKYFQGSLAYLTAVKEAVSLPVLRKDFVVDAYQLYEARAAGADAILLIAEVLSDAELSELLALAADLKLTALLEVHDAENLLRVRDMIGPRNLLGINNRDLTTFTVDVAHTLQLAPLAAESTTIVSESGIRNGRDTQRLAEAGVAAILVGETLMRSDDIAAAMSDLLGTT